MIMLFKGYSFYHDVQSIQVMGKISNRHYGTILSGVKVDHLEKEKITMKSIDPKQANQITRQSWDKNAAYWDEYMGEGNDFVEVLCWPSIVHMLDAQPGGRVLDIACGNGLTSRRLAARDFNVVAFDFSKEMINKAIQRTPDLLDKIEYHVLDATDENSLLKLGVGEFDAAISNMALFDIAEIDPLFRALSRLLRPGGSFVFSVTHPCFNNPRSILVSEMEDRSGEIATNYSVKVSEYLSPRVDYAVALRDQPEPQLIFHRPLQVLFNAGFEAGFVMDKIEERAFPADHPPGSNPLSWGANFHQIPPVLVARMKLAHPEGPSVYSSTSDTKSSTSDSFNPSSAAASSASAAATM